MNKKTFWETHVPQKTKTYVSWGIMAGVVYAVVALMSAFQNPAAIIDLVVVLGLTLGVLFGRSRACAVILLLLYVTSEFAYAYLIGFGILQWVMLIVFSACYVCGMLGTFEFQKYWKAYRKKGELPPKEA
nr:hypothetical protein [uncultured Christensenella sp.]